MSPLADQAAARYETAAEQKSADGEAAVVFALPSAVDELGELLSDGKAGETENIDGEEVYVLSDIEMSEQIPWSELQYPSFAIMEAMTFNLNSTSARKALLGEGCRRHD